jgi:transposase
MTHPWHLLTRDELEQRRLEAFRLWQSGMRWADIARAVGVSRNSTSKWQRLLTKGGLGALAKRPKTGRRPRLDPELVAEVYRTPGQCWSSQSFAEAICARFGVMYHPDHAGRLLVKLRRAAKSSTAGGGR